MLWTEIYKAIHGISGGIFKQLLVRWESSKNLQSKPELPLSSTLKKKKKKKILT